jgi:hypothetical protein
MTWAIASVSKERVLLRQFLGPVASNGLHTVWCNVFDNFRLAIKLALGVPTDKIVFDALSIGFRELFASQKSIQVAKAFVKTATGNIVGLKDGVDGRNQQRVKHSSKVETAVCDPVFDLAPVRHGVARCIGKGW